MPRFTLATDYGIVISDFSTPTSMRQRKVIFRTVVDAKTTHARIAALNSWCKKYLSDADRGKLKVAVRKRRERWRRGDEKKTITISAKAHKVLTQISKRDNVTFSQALENYLGKALNSARGTSNRRLKS